MTYLFSDTQEIKNEIGNPISISKNNANNSVSNPIFVDTGTITTIPDTSIGDFYGQPYSTVITPTIQLYGAYGIDLMDVQIFKSGGGSVTSTLSCFNVSNSANVGSYAVLRSRRFNSYKPGQSMIARSYLKFDNPAALLSQRWGLQNQENAFYIGYNGTNFGILHTHGGKVPLYKVTVTSFTGNQTVTVTLNSVPYTINIVTGESINLAAHRISDDGGTNYNNLWMTTQRGNTVEFLYIGALAPLTGTFSITSTGNMVASITTLQEGVASTDEWVYTTDVDGPVLPVGFDPTTFQQYQIKYSWSGVTFFVLDPVGSSSGVGVGRYKLIYTHYHVSGIITQPQISNPAFKIAALTLSLGSTSIASMYVGEMMMGVEGELKRNKYSRAAAATQVSLQADKLHHAISVQNTLTYNNTINCVELLLQDISVSSQSGDPIEVYVFLDAPLTANTRHDFSQTIGYVAGISKVIGEIDLLVNEPIVAFVTGTTGSSAQFDLTPYRAVVPPGSYITIACKSSAAIQKFSVACVWYPE